MINSVADRSDQKKPPRIAVIGDRMRDIDQHMTYVKDHEGVPVVRCVETIERSGGSAIVAEMCKALGAVVESVGLGESVKRRIFVDGRFTIRIDDDRSEHPTRADLAQWAADLARFSPDLILICDHGKGVVNRDTMDMAYAMGVPVYVDPCVRSDWSLFSQANCISANRNEWAKATINFAGMAIKRRDRDGVAWSCGKLPATCNEPVDTVGAGDQFLAVLACLRAQGESWTSAIEVANYTAGLQCERQGIVPVTAEELRFPLTHPAASSADPSPTFCAAGLSCQ